jgi:hypothetical protein
MEFGNGSAKNMDNEGGSLSSFRVKFRVRKIIFPTWTVSILNILILRQKDRLSE